jgi:hypothetical protein
MFLSPFVRKVSNLSIPCGHSKLNVSLKALLRELDTWGSMIRSHNRWFSVTNSACSRAASYRQPHFHRAQDVSLSGNSCMVGGPAFRNDQVCRKRCRRSILSVFVRAEMYHRVVKTGDGCDCRGRTRRPWWV